MSVYFSILLVPEGFSPGLAPCTRPRDCCLRRLRFARKARARRSLRRAAFGVEPPDFMTDDVTP